jgi:hypothetical protein
MQTQAEKNETKKIINNVKLVDDTLRQLQEPFATKSQAIQSYNNKLDDQTKDAILKEVSNIQEEQNNIMSKFKNKIKR